MIWLGTDFHLHHRKLTECGYRPENFTELIIANCEQMIAPEDDVYFLGDFVFGFDKGASIKEFFARVRGNWHLILGNHDLKPIQLYLDCGFKTVAFTRLIGDVLLSHMPINIVHQKNIRLNVHGHFHNDDHRHVDDFPFLNSKNRLLAMERVEYKPVDFYEFTK